MLSITVWPRPLMQDNCTYITARREIILCFSILREGESGVRERGREGEGIGGGRGKKVRERGGRSEDGRSKYVREGGGGK